MPDKYRNKSEYSIVTHSEYVEVSLISDTRKSNIGDFVSHLNQIFPTIYFIFEQKYENVLPFLDILVIRNVIELEFGVFMKEIYIYQHIPKNFGFEKII